MEEILLIMKTEAVVSAISVSLIGIFGVFITARHSVKTAIKSKEKQHSIDVDLENRKKKLELYQKWFDIMKISFQNSNSKKLESKTVDFYHESMFYASKDTILAILAFKVAANSSNQKNKYNVLFRVEDILFQMRKDLNLSNKGLKKGDLVKIIINDPRDIDAILKSQKATVRLKNYLFYAIKKIKEGNENG